jgi:hypothetical protein
MKLIYLAFLQLPALCFAAPSQSPNDNLLERKWGMVRISGTSSFWIDKIQALRVVLEDPIVVPGTDARVLAFRSIARPKSMQPRTIATSRVI